MAQRLLNLLAVVSLPLFAAASALCLRGRGTTDLISYTPGPIEAGRMTQWVVRTSPRGDVRVERRVVTTPIGRLRARLLSNNDTFEWPATWPDTWSERPTRLLWETRPGAPPPPVTPLTRMLRRYARERVSAVSSWRGLGVGWEQDRRDNPVHAATLRRHALTVPYWSMLLATAAAPAARLLRHARRRDRLRAGLCPACGYDLRATPGRCPECGLCASSPSR